MNDELKKALMEKATDGKLPCAVARKVAEDLRIPYKDVGDAANALGIRVKNCELGCF